MKPTLIHKYITDNLFDILLNEVNWINVDAPRDECFMSETPLKYGYGNEMFKRFYDSVPYHNIVLDIQNKLNIDYNTNYNVCFLNYYVNDKKHLGWHSDDSPEMDNNHPIAVISFGAERFIHTKLKTHKGEINNDDKFLLTNGSLFIMPETYQDEHFHKIPKHSEPCGGRISLTFRKYII